MTPIQVATFVGASVVAIGIGVLIFNDEVTAAVPASPHTAHALTYGHGKDIVVGETIVVLRRRFTKQS